ncbi:PH domain-containing protein [Acinetobacter celticus]|uniref:Uncharacterized protein YyaB-like PH domain-containing protein n=1 Tax=Acinetobacter celticus TaxID=1891224 RepID=A0A1C3D0D2_9GAMM|nr:PH domain-containing protein [Acinetobacter celticus]ODA14506.1 hypothetical protein BBP83_01495 [Acinetobacter celticus]
MQIFRSKIDWWVLGFLICLTGLLLQLLLTMQAKGTLLQFPVHAAVYVMTMAFVWWPAWNTKYTVDEEYLSIRCLFLTWKIKRSEIQSISKTNNSVASPALSLKRLKVDYLKEGESKFVLVSPRNQQAFCDALNQPLKV